MKQVKSRNFYPNLVLQTGIPALFTAILGTILVAHWEGYNKKYSFLFSLFFDSYVVQGFTYQKRGCRKRPIRQKYFGLTGLLTGLCTAFTGLGGGVVINPILNGLLKYPIKRPFQFHKG